MLAIDADDPAFDDAVLNPLVQEAVDSIVTDINIQNPGYHSATVTLTGAAHSYVFATQSSPLTNFARWLEVRWTDEDGLELHETRLEELRDAGADHFAVTGIDAAATLVTSKDSAAGKNVWMRYTAWPAELSSDSDVPAGIPARFHDVIALEAAYAFSFGGEQRTPAELRARWMDRRGQLMHHVGKRGVQASRTRIYVDPFE